MRTSRLYSRCCSYRYSLCLAVALVALLAPGVYAAPRSVPVEASLTQGSSDLPPAPIDNDEGGPVRIEGEMAYSSLILPTILSEPVAVLLDASLAVQRRTDGWAPRASNIIGDIAMPLADSPAPYTITLPIEPSGILIDVDNDGEEDSGVLVFNVVVSNNLFGDSRLEQLEQGGNVSLSSDTQTGDIRSGTLLVYAPDDAQGFPASAGADGIFFTEDDPAVTLPQGYTVANLHEDGTVTFDRSRIGKMDTIEEAGEASPDFSEMGFVDAFNALIDLLKVRYSYTDLHGIDWEEQRTTYLPQVQAAQDANDVAAYFVALNALALGVGDAHVQVVSLDPLVSAAPIASFNETNPANIGVRPALLTDGRIIVSEVITGSPAAEAGWQFGTEIVAIDGISITQRLAQTPYFSSQSTDEGRALARIPFLLCFAEGVPIEAVVRQPGASETETVTITPTVPDADEDAVPSPVTSLIGTIDQTDEIHFKGLPGDIAYIHWTAFDDLFYKTAVWERFLKQFATSNGIIIDMRGNYGGSLLLLYTLASYFIPADAPVSFGWLDEYDYDEKANDLVKARALEYPLSVPNPSLYYDGPVIVLVNEQSASAAEYIAQFLQHIGRATVMGSHGTMGAGGSIGRVEMPANLLFQFTKGRTYFAGTDEVNLEGKGVTLDVRVPVTEESLLAEQAGTDVVLEAAMQAMNEKVQSAATAALANTTWTLAHAYRSMSDIVTPDADKSYSIHFSDDGAFSVVTDCKQLDGTYAIGASDALTITVDVAAATECEADPLRADFLAALNNATSFANAEGMIGIAIANDESMLELIFQRLDE